MPLKILLAEDSVTIQKIALLVLERFGYLADVASNGIEAVEALRRQPYDVILMDVQMPEMDGLRATGLIRSEFPPDRQPYIIAMTANALPQDRDACLGAGMDDYISKPFQANELVRALRRCRGGELSKRTANESQGSKMAQTHEQPQQEHLPYLEATVLSPKALTRLRTTLGKQASALLPKLIDSFFHDAVELQGKAQQALEQSRTHDLRRAAHTLKSNAKNFGGSELARLCQELENRAKENNLEGAEELLASIAHEYAKVQVALEAMRKTLTQAGPKMTNETGSILIVEDDPINLILLSTCLHEEGHTIRTAENGRQAVDMLHSEHFDLMLLDLLMPEMDGFEVLKWIKARPDLRNLPVIVVSAEEDMKSIVRCIEMGATDYLCKPYEPTLLKTRVKTSLAMKRFYELGPYKGKILVIDNDPLDRAVLSVNLTEEGYTVGTADNGRVGLQMLREQPFDIVLLDLLMPEIDGFDVLKIIKADLRTRHLPVIVISGEEDLAGITRCIAIGAEDYMQKPFDPVLLRARVSACVEKKRLRDQEIRQQQDLNELNKALEVQVHRARIEALEQSQKELELLNRAKNKALDHLSHELGTPLSVIQGNLRILKRKLQTQVSPAVGEHFFKTLEKNLDRLVKIQEETDKIIKSYQNLERKRIFLLSFAERVLEKAKQSTAHRQLNFYLEGDRDLSLSMAPEILEDILSGLIKNAIESTPDEGSIRIILVQKDERLLLKVQDSGIGITEDNQKQILHGLFHTLDTELYQSKKPYDFGAGGKGLDLFMVKVYGQRFGFGLSVESQRCIYIPKDWDICPGRISACSHCRGSGDCETSGGTTFSLSFQISEEMIDDRLIT